MRRRAGFTLIEVIVAVSILAAGITVILRYFLFACSQADAIETEMAAEEFCAATLDRLALELALNGTLGADRESGQALLNTRAVSWEWSVSPVSVPDVIPEEETRLQALSVALSWKQDNHGRGLKRERYVVKQRGSER